MTDTKVPQPDWSGVYAELGIVEPPYDDRPLAAHIEIHARERPEAPAMVFATRIIDFAETDAVCRKLAAGLAGLGVSKGDVVGLHMPNIPQYMMALGAISRLGAIGSGLSPLMAQPELAHQIADAGMKAVIGLADFAPALAGIADMPSCLETVILTSARDHLDAPVFDMPEIGGVTVLRYLDVFAGAHDDIAQCPVGPDDIFIIQYTGGTTGRPNWAQLSVRNLMHNFIQVSAADPEYVPGHDVCATAFPLFHVAGLTFALLSLRVGSLFILLPNPRDTEAFCALMKAHPPTRLAAVPALYDMLLATPAFREIDFSGLHVVKTGAAPMAATTRDGLIEVVGPGKMADVFGMTETSPCYTMHPRGRYKVGSVGIPVPGADVRIADVEDRDRLLAPGEVGEIISTGVHVMKGYLNLPEETANALRELDGRRWMYSGDVGHMDEEGYVFVRDRAKDMLIVGGFKVFSVEVEEKVKGVAGVAECAVIGYPDTERPGNDVVHLFVQRESGVEATDAELSDGILGFCRENMARYKVPRHVHIIEQIPLTPVGKIDKKALRAVEPAA